LVSTWRHWLVRRVKMERTNGGKWLAAQAAKRQPSHYFLQLDTDHEAKIGRFIRTLLEYGD
jgi:hypothetical protein